MPNRSKLQRAINKRDKLRRNWCRRCPFCAPSGRCLNTTLRIGRCGDWVYYRLRGNKQHRRRWVRPKDPRTPNQLQNRARLGTTSHSYGAVLTEEERVACIAAGAKRQSRPRLGQSGPLTGQQYSVHKAYAKNAAAKVQNTRIPAKVPQPRKVTRPTWGPHQSIARVLPGMHRRGTRHAGNEEGRRMKDECRRKRVRAAAKVPQQQRVMRRCPGVTGQPGFRTFGGGGGGRLGDSGGRRRGLLSRGVFPANNTTCTNPDRKSTRLN